MTTSTFIANGVAGAGRPLLVRLALVAQPMWRPLSLNLVLAVFDQGVGLALPAFSALVVGRIAAGLPPSELPPLLGALAGLTILKAALGWAQAWVAHLVAVGLIASMRAGAYFALEPLAPAYTVKRRSGDIASMMLSDVDSFQVFFSRALIPTVVAAVLLVVVLSILASVALPLALILIPFLIAVGLLPVLGWRWTDPLAEAARALQGRVSAHFVDSIQGLRELVSFGRDSARVDEVRHNSIDLGAAQLRTARVAGGMGGLSDVLTAAGTLAVLITGIGLVTNGALDRFQLPLLLILGFGAFRAVADLAEVAKNLSLVTASAKRYFEVVDEPVPVVERAQRNTGALEPAVEFAGVTFRYGVNDAPVLANLTFRVESGETVALVGPSGAGKSTIASLLLRFWDPESGVIRIGGLDIRDLPLEDLRRRIAIVQQDNYLFNTSLRDNIRLGRPDATNDEVEHAARDANVDEFIRTLPGGYDTVAGERGVKLSGGQRQRIAIARALLKNAPILILDEATSNLDTENERLIRDAITRLMTGRTTLVIAHRISSIVSADRVVMIDRGRLIATGRHADLVEQDEAYRRLLGGQGGGRNLNPERSAAV